MMTYFTPLNHCLIFRCSQNFVRTALVLAVTKMFVTNTIKDDETWQSESACFYRSVSDFPCYTTTTGEAVPLQAHLHKYCFKKTPKLLEQTVSVRV